MYVYVRVYVVYHNIILVHVHGGCAGHGIHGNCEVTARIPPYCKYATETNIVYYHVKVVET